MKKIGVLLIFVLLCSFVFGDVFINEFLPNPSDSETREWIELYNNGPEEVNLNGWTIEENNGPETLDGFVISANGFLILERSEISFILNNGEDFLILKDGDIEIDHVSYGSGITSAPYPENEDESIGRKIDGEDTNVDNVDFQIFTIPSPGESNSPQESVISFSLTHLNFGTISQGGSGNADSVITVHEQNNVDLSFQISLAEGEIFQNIYFDLNNDGVFSADEQLDETLNYDVDDLNGEYDVKLPTKLNIPFGSVAGNQTGTITYIATERI